MPSLISSASSASPAAVPAKPETAKRAPSVLAKEGKEIALLGTVLAASAATITAVALKIVGFSSVLLGIPVVGWIAFAGFVGLVALGLIAYGLKEYFSNRNVTDLTKTPPLLMPGEQQKLLMPAEQKPLLRLMPGEEEQRARAKEAADAAEAVAAVAAFEAAQATPAKTPMPTRAAQTTTGEPDEDQVVVIESIDRPGKPADVQPAVDSRNSVVKFLGKFSDNHPNLALGALALGGIAVGFGVGAAILMPARAALGTCSAAPEALGSTVNTNTSSATLAIAPPVTRFADPSAVMNVLARSAIAPSQNQSSGTLALPTPAAQLAIAPPPSSAKAALPAPQAKLAIGAPAAKSKPDCFYANVVANIRATNPEAYKRIKLTAEQRAAVEACAG